MPQRTLSVELAKGNTIEKPSILHQKSHYSRQTKIECGR